MIVKLVGVRRALANAWSACLVIKDLFNEKQEFLVLTQGRRPLSSSRSPQQHCINSTLTTTARMGNFDE